MLEPFIRQLKLDSFLSFAPGTATSIGLRPLNVVIGPNGAGKSNLIEALELLRATSTDFASAIREGGGAEDWLWRGDRHGKVPAKLDVELAQCPLTHRPLRYRLDFAAVAGRVEILDEAIEETTPRAGYKDPFFYYRFQHGNPVINIRGNDPGKKDTVRKLERDSLKPDQSVLAQRKDPDLYPEVTWLGEQFGRIQTFREWSFGTRSSLRSAQRADDPADQLLPDARNLALVLNEIQHRDGHLFDNAMKRFLPRYERLSIRIIGTNVQFYLHETGLNGPISAARLSDGTLRFLAMLAALLTPQPPPLLCLEEPELGMHPDALAQLAELLVDASARMQIVVTTHSDTLLSALNDHVDSVLVCENNGAGSTIGHLDAERLAFWLKQYKLGEIWRLGEIGGNP
jgi:predicted ATPase